MLAPELISPPARHELTRLIDGGERRARRNGNNLPTPIIEKWVSTDYQL
jgi:hypothetical protein